VFKAHKPGQARISRTATLLAVLFFVAWGARSLAVNLPRLHSSLGRAWNELLQDASPADATKIDLVVYEGKFSPALTIAVVVLVAGGALAWTFLNRPRIADALIDMEAELHKVSWPSFPDAWQSTLVVSGFTALVVAIVFFYDIVIKGLMDLMPVRSV
jgi:preprotein translocase SecE subunit